jgi:hypothetical protein
MRKLDRGGVAVAALVVIVAASMGVATVTPVIVDVKDVDPDSPLYGLERLGERIRLVRDDDQMKERWGEYARLVDRGKGLEYKKILEEFVEKMHAVAPGDVEANQGVVQWMQDQMPGIGRVQLKLFKELCEGLKDDLPEAHGEIDEIIGEIENCEEGLNVTELREDAQAHLMLIREEIENIAGRHGARITRPVNTYFDIDNMLVDGNVTANIEINIRPIPITAPSFEEELEVFDNLLAEVQAMLVGAPENAAGKHAAERLVEVAIELEGRATTAYEGGKIRGALGLIYAAKMHLRNAKIILEHANEWEPEFTGQWTQWRNRWQELKQEFIEEGVWGNILGNWGQFAENVRQRWRERPLGI